MAGYSKTVISGIVVNNAVNANNAANAANATNAINAINATNAIQAVSASYALTASYAMNGGGGGGGTTTGSFTGSFTGSLLGTASYALTASFAMNGGGGGTTTGSFTGSFTGSLSGTASYATSAGTTSTITVNVFGSPVESYLLMSNVAGLPGVAIGGDADLRYNTSTNVLTVGNISATTLTGSLQGTSSWAANALTASYVLNAVSSSFASTASLAPNYVLNSATSSFVQNSQTSSFVTNSQTSSMSVLSSSFTSTASFINTLNQPVIISGSFTVFTGSAVEFQVTNIGVKIGNALTDIHQVTGSLNISGSITGSLSGTASFASTASFAANISSYNVTQSFTNSSTWTFNHNLGYQSVLIQAYDSTNAQIIPQTIVLTNANTATITFPVLISGYAIATVGGALATATASFTQNAVSSSFASTSSFVNILNQNVIITGSVAIGTGSVGNGENTLTLGPAPAGGAGEGGQLGLMSTGGSYTSASFIDNWQDQFRILRGPNNGSNAGLMYMSLQTGNTQFVGAVTASAYSGLPNDYLYVTRNTDQTVVTNWISTDIIFNNSVASKGISYNTGTGLASLTGGKVYRITARLAWSAAAAYLLEFSCYNSSNTQIGPTVQIVQSTNGSNNISDGTLDFIYAPVSNTDIKIRTTANTTALSGEKIRGDLNTQLIIQQIA